MARSHSAAWRLKTTSVLDVLAKLAAEGRKITLSMIRRAGVRKFPSIQLMGVATAAEKADGLRLLVLHGSRARGNQRANSDWDFGFLAESTFDADSLLARVSEELASDSIDFADLSRASGLLRFKAAADGYLLFESEPGLFDQFRLTAISAWCDMEPVLRRAYDTELSRLAT